MEDTSPSQYEYKNSPHKNSVRVLPVHTVNDIQKFQVNIESSESKSSCEVGYSGYENSFVMGASVLNLTKGDGK
jgi:hypothetical protein